MLNLIQPQLAVLYDASPWRWKEQIDAARILGRIPLDAEARSQAISTLLAVLEENSSLRTRWRRKRQESFNRAILIPAIISLLPVILTFLSAMSDWNPDLAHIMITITISLTVGFVVLTTLAYPFISKYDTLHLAQVRAAAATALGDLQAIESVPALARALGDRSLEVRLASLHAVLPRLTPDHYGRLDAQMVPNLCRLLRTTDIPFTLAILQALEHIGDGRAIPDVEHVAARGATSDIRETAAKLLPILQARQAQENAPRMLLRPSDSIALRPDALLRPAGSATETDAQQLLRAARKFNSGS